MIAKFFQEEFLVAKSNTISRKADRCADKMAKRGGDMT